MSLRSPNILPIIICVNNNTDAKLNLIIMGIDEHIQSSKSIVQFLPGDNNNQSGTLIED